MKQRKKDTHQVVQIVAEEAVAGIEAGGFSAPAGDTTIFYGSEEACGVLAENYTADGHFPGVTYEVRPVVPL